MKSLVVEIFTDGACKGNPGPGGWGGVLRYGDQEKHIKGYEAFTTNNRMELTAVIQALKLLKNPCVINLTTDSKYLQQGITVWLERWKRQYWKTSQKTPVKNIDLWQTLDHLVQGHQISWHWVKGHNHHRYNELADKLANQAIEEHRCVK